MLDTPIPEPAAGQVRVRITYAAVNPADDKVLRWKDGASFLHAKTTPLVVGYDFAGTVDALGAGVTAPAVGAEVFGFVPYKSATRHGTFAEYTVVAADQLAPRPAALPPAQAAALATGGSTALQVLRDLAKVQAGQRVLVNGASGGVGLYAVQIAKALGAEVWGTCSAAKADFVVGLGADRAVDYRATAIGTLSERFDVVFDAASMSSYSECAPILKDRGVYVTLLPSPAFVWGKLLSLFSTKRSDFAIVKAVPADLTWLADRAASGTLRAPVETEYPLERTGEALAAAVAGKASGKIVIRVAPSP